jgi:hypothetical protein
MARARISVRIRVRVRIGVRAVVRVDYDERWLGLCEIMDVGGTTDMPLHSS